MKKTRDYDNTFQTIKKKHKRLLIAVINDCFQKQYPLDASVELLPTRAPLVSEGNEGDAKIEDRDSDCVLRIGEDYYLVEVQAYDDENMAIRIAEYTFIAARNTATGNQCEVTLNIPHFTVIYIKPMKDTPHETKITYLFPDGQEVCFTERNIFLSEITKEEIIEKKLYAYIPFYIARYEHELSTVKNYQKALEDLAYFRDKMVELHQNREMSGDELTDLGSFVNTIVTHITDGNTIEKEVTSIMGGTAYETESERIRRVAREEMQAELEEKDRAIEAKEKTIEETRSVLEEKEKTIEETRTALEEKEKTIEETRTALEEKEKTIEETRTALEEKEKTIEEARNVLEEKEKMIEETRTVLEEKDRRIAELEEALRKAQQ